MVNMEKFRTSTEVRQKAKEREKIVEHAVGSLPVRKEYLKLASIFFSNLGPKKPLVLMKFTDGVNLRNIPKAREV